MITLYHGDHIEASRNELNRLKVQARNREIRQIDGTKIDNATLIQSLESRSMFADDSFIIIERLFARMGRQQKKIQELCIILRNAPADVVLWEDKEVSATVIKNLGNAPVVRVFKLPALIFQFLDTFHLKTFESLMETEAPELVFSMLIKRVRQLILICDGGMPAGLQSWQARRLTTQARSFTMDELIRLYDKLGEAEYAIKSGSSPFSFRQLLEQALMDIAK